MLRLQDELAKQRDRYDRLLESHKKLQKLNNELEDKLITVVSRLEAEKLELTETLSSMQHKLTDVEALAQQLEDERDRLKSDCTLAVQLLHCRPSEFIAYRLSELPLTLQERVRGQLTREEILELEDYSSESSEPLKPVRVPIPTFPPTAVCALRNVTEPPVVEENNPLRRVNTVPMSLVARALLPPDDNIHDNSAARRRHGDVFVCALCRRSESVLDGDNLARNGAVHGAGELSQSSDHGGGRASASSSCLASPGVHRARRSPTQLALTLSRS
jgi:tight junction protein 4 (peripheral)